MSLLMTPLLCPLYIYYYILYYDVLYNKFIYYVLLFLYIYKNCIVQHITIKFSCLCWKWLENQVNSLWPNINLIQQPRRVWKPSTSYFLTSFFITHLSSKSSFNCWSDNISSDLDLQIKRGHPLISWLTRFQM